MLLTAEQLEKSPQIDPTIAELLKDNPQELNGVMEAIGIPNKPGVSGEEN